MKAITATHALLAILAACSPTPAAMTGFGAGPPGGSTSEEPGSSSGSAAAESTDPPGSTGAGGDASTSGTSEAASSGGGVPDLGTPPDIGSLLPAGCDGKKIDFVFVISNSNSMAPKQQRLLAAFPDFMAAIEARNIDKHILVTTPVNMWLMSDCADCQWDCDEYGEPPKCGAKLTECDSLLGAGYTFPAGKGASNRRCELAGGNRYITEEEEDVTAAFECLATVGLDGGDNRQVGAALAAISPELNAPGACNAGFLRRDALLVVTIIANGWDEHTPLYASEWAEELLAAKQGNADAIYFLVITSDVDIPGHVCEPDNPYVWTKGRTRMLAELLPHASVGSVCAEDYAPFFSSALTTIVDLCDSFVPPP